MCCRADVPKPSPIRQAIEAAGPRANLLAGREKTEIGPLEVFYTDFTELIYAGGTRKAWLIPLLDHATKYVPAFAVGERANSELALSGLDGRGESVGSLPGLAQGCDRPSGPGSRIHQLRLDRDPALGRRAPLLALGGPKDNPEIESFFGRFKVENGSLLSDARSLEELLPVVGTRMRYYNRVRRHSSLGDRPPLTIIEDFYREG